MNGLITSPRPPSRAMLYRMIERGNERHRIKFTSDKKVIEARIRELDFDCLFDLAFLAISDINNEEAHKMLFVDRCKELGLK